MTALNCSKPIVSRTTHTKAELLRESWTKPITRRHSSETGSANLEVQTAISQSHRPEVITMSDDDEIPFNPKAELFRASGEAGDCRFLVCNRETVTYSPMRTLTNVPTRSAAPTVCDNALPYPSTKPVPTNNITQPEERPVPGNYSRKRSDTPDDFPINPKADLFKEAILNSPSVPRHTFDDPPDIPIVQTGDIDQDWPSFFRQSSIEKQLSTTAAPIEQAKPQGE